MQPAFDCTTPYLITIKQYSMVVRNSGSIAHLPMFKSSLFPLLGLLPEAVA